MFQERGSKNIIEEINVKIELSQKLFKKNFPNTSLCLDEISLRKNSLSNELIFAIEKTNLVLKEIRIALFSGPLLNTKESKINDWNIYKGELANFDKLSQELENITNTDEREYFQKLFNSFSERIERMKSLI